MSELPKEPLEHTRSAYQFWVAILVTVGLSLAGLVHMELIAHRIQGELQCIANQDRCAAGRLRQIEIRHHEVDSDWATEMLAVKAR